MPSTNPFALICISLLAASTIAHPPPHHIPSGTALSSGTAPHFPFPTGTIPCGTATNGNPIIPLPTMYAPEEPELEKRFEGPRHQSRPVAWHRYSPNLNVVRPSGAGHRPSGTQGLPTAGPTASRPAARPTGY